MLWKPGKSQFLLFHVVFAVVALLGLFLGKDIHFALLLLVLFYITSTIILLKLRTHDLWKEAFILALG